MAQVFASAPIAGDSRSATIFTVASTNEEFLPFRAVASCASTSSPASSSTPSAQTPLTEVSIGLDENDHLGDLHKYVAMGCLHLEHHIPSTVTISADELIPGWIELVFSRLSDKIKFIIGKQAWQLLEARWVRLFLHSTTDSSLLSVGSIIRVYLLPEDWGRRFIDRRSKSLKTALRQLLAQVDTSREAWFGDPRAERRYFDPWASPENVSLYYLFNNLPSPAPSAKKLKNRYSRNSVLGLLEAAVPFSYDDPEDFQPIPGLKTRLYPYQARSAALMVQRESAPQPQLDPRLEVRESPSGEKYFFGGRDGSVLREPRFYETTRGGILAETMGLGKTIICLAVILATKGHIPQIPPAYQQPPPIRPRTGRLTEIAAHCAGRHAIPAKAYLKIIEATEGLDMGNCKRVLDENFPFYDIPAELPRMNRMTRIPPPHRVALCGGTIIVVPRNLLHQWQGEIRKHVAKDALKILVMDSKSKRTSKNKAAEQPVDRMAFQSELPALRELADYDIVLFTKNRFEQDLENTAVNGHGSSAPDLELEYCDYTAGYGTRHKSPLKRLHWLRIIIDEGHNFSSGLSNAVLLAKQLHVERRWVVSGTPAKNLVGVELDTLTQDNDDADPALLRELAMEQRRNFTTADESTKAAKALGSLASHFLCVRPWCESTKEGKLEWDDYIYRHAHQYRKTYSGFSTCFLRTLEGLVVKTRPEDVERDIQLPPMRHRTVYLKPCWYDKMTANMFIQVLRANAITSERRDIDYLFHKNSIQARHSLIKNLRQSNFTWTGFSVANVADTIDTSDKYLNKEEMNCTVEDAIQLLESCNIVYDALKSDGWVSLSKAHEVGLAVAGWPEESEEYFALAKSRDVAIVGNTQLLQGQSHVDQQILSHDPAEGLDAVGKAVRADLEALEEAEKGTRPPESKGTRKEPLAKAAVPSSCVGGQPLTSRKAAAGSPSKKARRPAAMPKASSSKTVKSAKPLKRTSSAVPSPATTQTPSLEPNPEHHPDTEELILSTTPASPTRPRKRKLTLTDELASLPPKSPLLHTRILGTTSAKLTYLLDTVLKHQATSKIIIFYDGDNAAYYIAQCLEMLYINHRIYARTLDNTTRSQYVTLFNSDPDIRVLLIDVACGALGLNLNAASVVLIVNPINRPGIEAQAIKRAHRIGQTREVLVETLVLEGTIEEAIFRRAKKMSRGEHQEAKTLEDDDEIISIIQNASVLPIAPDEGEGESQFALLKEPQQVFGRPGRERYHRFGQTKGEGKAKGKGKGKVIEGPRKKVCAARKGKEKQREALDGSVNEGGVLDAAGAPV